MMQKNSKLRCQSDKENINAQSIKLEDLGFLNNNLKRECFYKKKIVLI